MEIQVNKNEGETVLNLEGRLDTNSAPELERTLGTLQEEESGTLIFDFEKLRYISSAGLRVLLSAQKKVNAKRGDMIVRGVNDLIMEIFEATGFVDILTIEND